MNKLPVALLGLVTLGTSAAFADEGLAIGASVGYVNIEDSEPGFDFDASDTGYKLFANYEFANHLAIEGGYVDFGKPEDVVLGLPGEIDASGWNLYGVGNLPLSGGVDLFAKAGIVGWEADSIIDGIRVDTEDGTDLALGFGARWKAGNAFGIRAEVDWFDIDEADSVWMASVGFELRF
jgi:OOP family OmpA-OmpF porin